MKTLTVALLLLSTSAIAAGRYVNEPPFKARCDGQTDDTAAINAALLAVCGSGNGGEVIIPIGTCMIAPSLDTTFLHLYSNCSIRGVNRARSIIKVVNNAGNYDAVFASNTDLTNISFRDLTIDQNAPNQQNPPTDVRIMTECPSGAATCSQTAIGCRGGCSISGITVNNVAFDTLTGGWAVIANNNGPVRANISNSYFNFQKARTLGDATTPGGNTHYDNSAIYLEGSEQVVSKNTFTSTLDGSGMAQSAIEIHGGQAKISNNTISNYAVMLNVCPTSLNYNEIIPNDITIVGNIGNCAQQAINLGSNTGRTLRKVDIIGNTINICNVSRGRSLSLFGQNYLGVYLIWQLDLTYEGNTDGLNISNNVITFQRPDLGNIGGYDSVTGGILLNGRGSLSNSIVQHNVIKDSPYLGIKLAAPKTIVIKKAAQITRTLGNTVTVTCTPGANCTTLNGSNQEFVKGGFVYLTPGEANFPPGLKQITGTTPTTFTYLEKGADSKNTQAQTFASTIKGIKVFDNVIIDAGHNNAVPGDPYRAAIQVGDPMNAAYVFDSEIRRNMIRDTAPGASVNGRLATDYQQAPGSANIAVGKNTITVLGTGRYIASAGANHGVLDTGESLETLTSSSSATPFTPNPSVYSQYVLTPTIRAITIANPVAAHRGQTMQFTIRRTGEPLAVSWGSKYRLSWVDPGVNSSRAVTFVFDGANWIQKGQVTADIPN